MSNGAKTQEKNWALLGHLLWLRRAHGLGAGALGSGSILWTRVILAATWRPLSSGQGCSRQKETVRWSGDGEQKPGVRQSRASGPRRATEHDASIGMEREAARRVDAVAPRLHQMSQGLHLLSHPASHQRSLRTSVTPILQIRKLRLREEHCLSVTQYEADTGYAHRSFLHKANLQAMGRRARPVLHRGRRGPVCCGDALGKLQSRKLLSGHWGWQLKNN